MNSGEGSEGRDPTGDCQTGQKSTHRQGSVDRTCHSYDGKDVTFVCEVFCTYCQ